MRGSREPSKPSTTARAATPAVAVAARVEEAGRSWHLRKVREEPSIIDPGERDEESVAVAARPGVWAVLRRLPALGRRGPEHGVGADEEPGPVVLDLFQADAANGRRRNRASPHRRDPEVGRAIRVLVVEAAGREVDD